MAQNSSNTFTAEEEQKIQKAVDAAKEQARQDLIDAEIRNRILDAQSQQPGYRYC